jgi:L-ascorbate 6-phosphate lactonase
MVPQHQDPPVEWGKAGLMDFRFWILDFGTADFGFWISDFGTHGEGDATSTPATIFNPPRLFPKSKIPKFKIAMVLKGKPLFDDVRGCPDEAAFWWLGQHSFILKLGHRRMLIDPFLTEMEERRVPPLFAPADATGVIDLVLCTHDHIDHIDPAAIPGLAEHTSAVFVAPRAHERRMRDLGVPSGRLVLLNDGESTSVDGVAVHAIKAAHETFDETDEGFFPFLGYVIEGSGRTVYHAGDTLWWEGLQARLRRWSLDVAMVPINGRDAKRFADDVQGNMTYQEAADLLGGLDVRLSVPTHYDMFEFNAENPELFVAYMQVKYPDHPVWVGDPTERIAF